MNFIICPKCRQVKFIEKDGTIVWERLTPSEELVLEIIFESENLSILVDGYNEEYERCPECDLSKQN